MLPLPVDYALNEVEKMGEVIDCSSYFKQKTWLNKRFVEAWALRDKYAERYKESYNQQDLYLRQYWMNKAIYYGQQLDELGGPL